MKDDLTIDNMSEKLVRKPIPFQRSMTADKRNENFAYLRKNAFASKSPGLYPSKDFELEGPTNLADSDNIMDIVGSEDASFDIKVIVEAGNDTKFYNLGSNVTSNTTLTNVEPECAVFGDDGVKMCGDDDDLYHVHHTNSNTSTDGTFTDARPDIGGYDGLYYWWLSNNEIYKSTNGAPTVAFNNIGLSPRFVDFLNDQMVIFCQEAGSIIILFWDKSDTDLFDKRIVIPNAKLIAGGVSGGVLQCVYGVGNSSNPKERNGEIVVAQYDGEKFVEQNSIKAGDDELDYEDVTGVGVGAKVIVFSVEDNDDSHNTDLYQNYVYKIHPDGAIEVQFLPDEATYSSANIVKVFYNFICIAQRGTGAQQAVIWTNEHNSATYNSYANYTTTEYITNFLNNPRNRHRLEEIGVAFEKLFEQTTLDPTGEQLEVLYRVSERDDFTSLGTITVEKVKDNINPKKDQQTEYDSDSTGLPEQVYKLKPIKGTLVFPEYHEIQYKFISKYGFSVIDAWYDYSYVSRA